MLSILLVLALLATACGGDGDEAAGGGSEGASESAQGPDPSDWEAVLAEADGQTVNWFMFGGDESLNSHVDGVVTELAAEAGVTVEQVRINDTVEAVNTVLGEVQAGQTTDGSVDMIWINGENFATGMQADLWHCDWAEQIPNAELVGWDQESINSDFGLPVEGCEAPWNSAQSVVVYDSEVVPDGFESASDLLTWIEENPGRFAYPAPPDFTGSMVVRTFLYAFNGGADNVPAEFSEEALTEATDGFWERMNELEPSLWREGSTYPQSQQEVLDLFANDQIDVYLGYEVAQVVGSVADGTFPESTQTGVFADGGSIANTNYVAIPANSPDIAGAMVLANILQSPEAQQDKATLGFAPVIDPEQTDDPEAFAIDSEAVPPFDELLGNASPELSSDWVQGLEEGWEQNVLQQ